MAWKSIGAYNAGKTSTTIINKVESVKDLPPSEDNIGTTFQVANSCMFKRAGLYTSNGKRWKKI